MFGIKRVVVGDGERALLYKNRRFERVLGPGVVWLYDLLGRVEVRVFDASRPEYEGKDVDALIERLGAQLEEYFVLADLAVSEVGFVSKNGKLEDVLAPGVRKLYWKGPVRVTIDPIGTNELSYELQKTVADYLNAVRLIGEDLEIRPPIFVPLEIKVVLCAEPDVWAEDIRFVLEQEFSTGWTPDGRKGFFHPDLWTFGQPLYASQIIGRALQVRGVAHAVGQKVGVGASEKTISVSIKRRNSTVLPTDSLTQLNYNEIIQVLNDPDHLEQGTIVFDVKGGRQ